ncbi:MAG TPA: pitrilysin family protein [Phycisphaerae bacterium]|nr:pitrilysin family protein [Phycisphaerae bacterium]HRY68932.1 pitrilysin family protein [Phycisphaerae bacterium]HSA25759.1 pitrilysin family protein [Phycisphaerae bacterium]
MSAPRFIQHRLENGLRLVIEVMPHVPSVACGFLVRTGARDDPPEMAGVSHFLEHMCFKGTAKRSWEQVNIEFDEMGAQYNAFTSKDRTFYYGWVRSEDFERQLGLLADIMRPTLPAGEFDMEKNVVLEEIAMSNDDLASNAYDFLYERICPGSPLSWPVLGYERTIRAMTRDQMAAYHRRRYAASNLVLIVAGDIEPGAAIAAVERTCGGWESDGVTDTRRPPPIASGVAVRQLERFHQQAVLLAFPAPSAADPLDETAEAVAAILGGSNSRFYWNIVQKGLSTRAGAFREEYGDFGVMLLYALCEPEHCERVLDAMRREAQALADWGPEPKELQRVKNLRRTSLATESEAPFYRLGQIADDVDYLGRPRPAEERLAAVDAITAETVGRYLGGYSVTGQGHLVSVGPRAWPA